MNRGADFVKHRDYVQSMKKQLIILTILLSFIKTQAFGNENSMVNIIGKWETDPYVSQFGKAILKYEFYNNNKCTSSMIFLQTQLPEMSDKAICEFKEDTLVIKNRNGVFNNKYTFQDDILTIIESGGDKYILKRKR